MHPPRRVSLYHPNAKIDCWGQVGQLKSSLRALYELQSSWLEDGRHMSVRDVDLRINMFIVVEKTPQDHNNSNGDTTSLVWASSLWMLSRAFGERVASTSTAKDAHLNI